MDIAVHPLNEKGISVDSDGFFGPGAVEFAGNGRYLLDIDGQGQKSYTRATTVAKTLESTYHLDIWHQKNAVKGVAQRPDLTARATVTPVSDKQAWKEILEQAEVVAAGGAKRNLGSAFHSLHDTVHTMSDEEYAAVPADIRDLYEKYRAELARLGIVELVSEATVCASQIGTAGKADGFVRMPDGSIRVLDRKSGRVTDYPHAPACQLAIYINATHILIDGAWKLMSEVFPTLDRETGLIVDVTYATETTPASVHIYEIDLMAGWYGALLATKVRRWRNRKDLLTPYQPEQMPIRSISVPVSIPTDYRQEVANAADAADRAASVPEISGAAVPFPVVEPGPATADLMPVAAAGVPAPSGHPAWSSAQQKVIQLSPDGTAAASGPAKPYGFTAAQIAAGEHKNAAEKAEAVAAAALQAAADRQEAQTAALDQKERTSIIGDIDPDSDADQLLKLFKDKAKLQAAARQLDPGMKVNRTRANLANDMTAHPQWAARRGEFIADSAPVKEAFPEGSAWKPSAEQTAQAHAAQQAQASQQYPNAGLPAVTGRSDSEAFVNSQNTGDPYVQGPPRPASSQDNPFAEPAPAPVDPPSAPKTPEDLALEAVSMATDKTGLALVWERCQENKVPWSARLQQAAQVKMSSFTQ